MSKIAEINRFLAQKLAENNLDEVDAITAARWLDDANLLKDSKHRPGLPLRKHLRAGKISGAYQYPNRRWVIRRTPEEKFYSVQEVAKMLKLTEMAIYKKIERGLIKTKKIGTSTIVIPESEIKRQNPSAQDDEAKQIENFKKEIALLKDKLLIMLDELYEILRRLSNISEKLKVDQINRKVPLEEDLTMLEKEGFTGFLKVTELVVSRCSQVPNIKGVYLVLRLDTSQPIFLDENVGGKFKGKNPTVSKDILESKWVPGSKIIYIGQAGGGSSEATLHSRIKQLIDFGSGKPIGHWGGRYIWQVKGYEDFIICWKLIFEGDPLEVEKSLLNQFIQKYGKLPFANLTM